MINQTGPTAIPIGASRIIQLLPKSKIPFWDKSLFLYLLFGGIAAITNLSVGWILYAVVIIPHFPYWAAVALAATAGLFTNFFLNHSFNFRYHGRSAVDQFKTFCVVSGVGILLTSFISVMIKHIVIFLNARFILSLDVTTIDFAAHFAAVALVVLYSFPAHKALTFNVGLCARLQELKSVISG